MAKVTETSSSALPVKRIRVYKRPDESANGDVFDSLGFVHGRRWTCSGVPEDSRRTCYETWEAAMEWATMCHEKRVARIVNEAKYEMGQ